MKRGYSSQETTQESQATILSEDMPAYKRTKKSYKKRPSYFQARKVGVARSPSSNSIIIPRVVDYDFDLSADFSHGFAFSAVALWINGTSVTGYSGASEIYSLFDLVRVHKVEISIIPGQSDLQITTPGIGAAYNLPFLYEAFDPNDSTNPSLNDMRELCTTRTHRYGPNIIRRTIYPVLNEANNVIDTGKSRYTTYVRSDDNTTYWCAWKCYMDMVTAVLTYAQGRISFKVYLECKNSK